MSSEGNRQIQKADPKNTGLFLKHSVSIPNSSRYTVPRKVSLGYTAAQRAHTSTWQTPRNTDTTKSPKVSTEHTHTTLLQLVQYYITSWGLLRIALSVLLLQVSDRQL